jgi:hypothetical protein
MKKILLVISIIVSVFTSFAQVSDDLNTITTIRRISTEDAAVNDSCTFAADRFVLFINYALDKNYPSKVTDVVMTLSIKGDSAELRYTASIKPCDRSEAMRKFEHRGTIRVLADEFSARSEAKRLVDAETDKFIIDNGGWKVAFREHANAVREGDNFWIVYENFLASSQ